MTGGLDMSLQQSKGSSDTGSDNSRNILTENHDGDEKEKSNPNPNYFNYLLISLLYFTDWPKNTFIIIKKNSVALNVS